MKKWLRRALIAIGLIGMTLAGLYEYATHVGRGWLRGEAFFDGQPTSYWAERCDEWLARFDDNGALVQYTWCLPVEIPAQEGIFNVGMPEDLVIQMKGGSMALPRETIWNRIRDAGRLSADLDRDQKYHFAPKILWGTPETGPVLEELALNEEYRPLATLALRRVEGYRRLQARFEEEAAEKAIRP
jgi:hypothetical protein